MIDRGEILAVATELSLSPDIVEKDYVLGWLLAAIYAQPELAATWVFKGGTCLKKCYFETYRFSEDLDFTLSDTVHLDERFLRDEFTKIASWLYDNVGIDIPADQLRFDIYQNPRGNTSCEGRIYYNGPLRRAGALPRIKLDLTADEIIVHSPVERPIGHPYSDRPATGMAAQCYSYSELMGEKLRALGERTRPRDLYDVVNLFRFEQIRPAAADVLMVLQRKCAFKGITMPTVATVALALDELQVDWAVMLGHQLPALPSFESFWSTLPDLFNWLATGAAPATPAIAPIGPGEVLLRPPVGALRGAGVPASSHLEIVRFAASNHLCVNLLYNGSVRSIEPYSLRRTGDGHVLLYAIRSNTGELRSYRVDRIQGATVSAQTFTPRFAIELTPTEMGGIPALPPRSASSHSFVRRARSRSGPIYVYECPACGKRFRRTKANSRLNPHKTKYGLPCYGRSGYLTDTIY